MAEDGFDYDRLYSYRHRGVDQPKRQAVWDEISPFLHRLMERPTRILDPAAGRGEFVRALIGVERWVVDSVDYAEVRYPPEVKVVIGDALTVELPEGYFDGIFVSNLLEHFASQLEVNRFLRHMLEATAPGGCVAVMGPNFRYCSDQYFDCADHTVPLTHVAVEEHLHAAGFELLKVIPRFLPYSFRGSMPASPALVRAYLRTPFAWRVLGKQFLVLARRPA